MTVATETHPTPIVRCYALAARLAARHAEGETRETLVAAHDDAITELVADADLAAYRRRQRAAGRFISSSVVAGGGYYVTTVTDPR